MEVQYQNEKHLISIRENMQRYFSEYLDLFRIIKREDYDRKEEHNIKTPSNCYLKNFYKCGDTESKIKVEKINGITTVQT